MPLSYHRAMRILVALFLAASLAALAQQPQPSPAARPGAAIEALLQQRPQDATLWFYLARAQAQAGDRDGAMSSLGKVLELGDGFLPRREDFASLWNDAAFKALRAKMEAKLPRLDYAPAVVELADAGLIPEGIAYDIPSRSLFMGSIAAKKVVRIREDGGISDFAGPGSELDSVLGIAVDSPRRILYAVTTTALTVQGEKQRRNAIVAYDVDNRRFLNRYDVSAAKQLNDVAVAPGGRVFTTDSASGAVYEIAIKGPGPAREIVPPGQLRGSNGLAVSPDAKRLYIATATGLAVVTLEDNSLARVENRTRETVAAIDGLYAWQGELIGVQNFTNPGRVIRMSLSPDGNAVTEVHTLLSHHHNQMDEPTTAALTDKDLLVLVATGIAHYTREGRVDDVASLPRPTVVRLPLPR